MSSVTQKEDIWVTKNMENMYLISKGIELGASQHRKNQRNQQNHPEACKVLVPQEEGFKDIQTEGETSESYHKALSITLGEGHKL